MGPPEHLLQQRLRRVPFSRLILCASSEQSLTARACANAFQARRPARGVAKASGFPLFRVEEIGRLARFCLRIRG